MPTANGANLGSYLVKNLKGANQNCSITQTCKLFFEIVLIFDFMRDEVEILRKMVLEAPARQKNYCWFRCTWTKGWLFSPLPRPYWAPAEKTNNYGIWLFDKDILKKFQPILFCQFWDNWTLLQTDRQTDKFFDTK